VKIQKGASGARSDDTKSLKGAILDWITPRGQQLNPPLARNIKTDRGFHHERTGALLCPADLDWSNIEYVLSFYFEFVCTLMFLRTKEKLRNGEIIVSGDQLPLFIYQSYHYDPEDPWNGLLRSSLLVSVCSCRFRPTRGPNVHIFARLTNISLHPQVPSRRSPKRLGRGTRESMG
jgi:hypothetical protein